MSGRSISRRQFLRWMMCHTGAIIAAQVVSACKAGPSPEPLASKAPLPTALPSPFLPSSPTTELVPGEASEPTETSSPAFPDLVVGRGGEPEELVRRVLRGLGGMERFVPAGSKVVVKPNICVGHRSYEYAATTNPWVVGTVVKLCIEAGASQVRVMDTPFSGTPEQAYNVSGIEAQVLSAGGAMEIMAPFKFVPFDIAQGLDLKRWPVYDDVMSADVVINVPIAKHHSLARLTVAMKNLMGVITDRSAFHANLGQRLADLASLIRPELTLVDGIRVLRAHGPSGGNLDDVVQMDTVIASADFVAADSYAATLLGLRPEDLSYVQAAAAMGLGTSDLGALRIEEVTVGA